MTVATGLHHVLRPIQPGRVYDSILMAASWTIGCCMTGDYLDYWLRRFWRSSFVTMTWSHVHSWLWPF